MQMPWDLYFRRARDLDQTREDPILSRAAEALGQSGQSTTRPGCPFLLDSQGRPEPRVNRWFSSSFGALAPLTLRKYAFKLKVWLNFLEALGTAWEVATSQDVEAFKSWRMIDPANSFGVAPGTHDSDIVILRLFYVWAGFEYGVSNPVRVRRGRRGRPDGSSYSELAEVAPSAVRDRDVKWFDPAGYARYRDLGLLGLDSNGVELSGWRGRSPQRDAAFADGLYGTGLRLQEWSSVLLGELPDDDPDRGFYTCRLAAATAKGGFGRHYWMPRRTLTDVLSYCDGERAGAVARGQAAGRYERLHGARVLVGYVGARRARIQPLQGGPVEVRSLDSMTAEARLQLLRETPAGLEPAALWLNLDGMPRASHGWHHTFATANRRLARMGLTGFAAAPHMLRHILSA